MLIRRSEPWSIAPINLVLNYLLCTGNTSIALNALNIPESMSACKMLRNPSLDRCGAWRGCPDVLQNRELSDWSLPAETAHYPHVTL